MTKLEEAAKAYREACAAEHKLACDIETAKNKLRALESKARDATDVTRRASSALDKAAGGPYFDADTGRMVYPK